MSWTTASPDLVIFGIVPWSSRWQRPHHFTHQFSQRGHRVVYITPHMLVDGQAWRELKGDTGISNMVLVQLGAVNKNSIHEPGDWTNEDLEHAHHAFWCVVAEERLRCPILFVQSPAWWPLLSWITKRAEFPVIYDCLDEHSGWNDEMADTLRGWEEEVVLAVDLALASAPRLQARLECRASRVLLVPNGCDAAHFEGASGRNGVVRGLRGGPVVGYYGAISAGWFDTGLVVTLAESRPDWNFVLIGPADDEVQVLLDGSPNILLLGEVPYSELPLYAADFDVAIIPFLVNELTAATDPVKLYEYFAAGTPVVSTPIPTLYGLQGLLRIAENAAGFERAIAALIQDPGDGAERSAVAQGASWVSRVESFYGEAVACLPSLDVVILIEGNSDSVRRCVDTIRSDTSYEATLIIVDNGATGATSAYVEELEINEVAAVVRTGGNVDVGAAIEMGIGAGRGRYVLVAASNVELPRGTMLGLLNVLARSRDVWWAGAIPDWFETAGERYQPEFASASKQAAFFEGHAWANFCTEADVDRAVCPVWILRRSHFEMYRGSARPGILEVAGERGADGQMRSLVAGGVMVHEVSSGSVARLDPILWRALRERDRRTGLTRRPS